MRRFSKLKFADYVRKTREARGLSLRQLAKKADMTLARCFAIENGEARLNLPQLVSLADAFGFRSGSEFLKKYESKLKAGEEKEPRKRKAAVATA
jgi:transcriptional regulator with XRE-family HTH domain